MTEIQVAPFVLALLAFQSADAPGVQDKPKGEHGILVAQGEGYFIHALRYPRSDEAETVARVHGGWKVLHTGVRDGAMNVLFTSGSFERPTRRISYQNVRIVGIACDSKRLYLVSWRAKSWDGPLVGAQTAERTEWRLHVYQRENGQERASVSLKSVDLEFAPKETIEKGPITLVEGGVEILGTKHSFPD